MFQDLLARSPNCLFVAYAVLCSTAACEPSPEPLPPGERDRYRLLFRAANMRKESARALESLAERGFPMKTFQYKDSNAITLATRFATREAVRSVLDMGVDPNLRAESQAEYWTDYSPTALECAAVVGDVEKAKLLLEYGADVDLCRYGKGNVLFSFATIYTGPQANGSNRNLRKMIELLVQHGADFDAEDRYGRTPLMAALEAGNLVLIRELHDMGRNDVFHAADEKVGGLLDYTSKQDRYILEEGGPTHAEVKAEILAITKSALTADLETADEE